MFVVQIIGFVTLFAAFVVGSPTIKVNGGQPATVEEYPFLAQLTVAKPDGMTGRCSASIIAPQYIISAYHCITKDDEPSENYDIADVLVITGTSEVYYKSKKNGIPRKVEQFFHKNATTNETFHGVDDLLIIKLAEAIEFNDVHQPIILNANESLNIGDTAFYAGVAKLPGQNYNVFHQAKTTILHVFSDNYIYDTSTSRAVGGDSGGPFFSKVNDEWVQHGIVPSNGNYAPRISYLCDWIKEVTNNEVDC